MKCNFKPSAECEKCDNILCKVKGGEIDGKMMCGCDLCDNQRMVNGEFYCKFEDTSMFRWIDYEENSTLFIRGIPTNVAILRHKNYKLIDNATSVKFDTKASSLDEAKEKSEEILIKHWEDVYKQLDRNLKAIREEG